MKAKCPICGRKITVEDKRWFAGHTTERMTQNGQSSKTCEGSGKVVKR